MASSTQNIAESLSKVGDTIGRKVSDMADGLGPTGRDIVDRGRHYGEQAQTAAEQAVHQRPIAMLVVAVALGFALGALWR